MKANKETGEGLTPPPSFHIPPDKARFIGEANQAAVNAQRELERTQLVLRVRFLEAFLGALGIDVEQYDVIQTADGSLEVKLKVVEMPPNGGAEVLAEGAVS